VHLFARSAFWLRPEHANRQTPATARWDLGLSTYQLADRVQDHGWTNATAKKICDIENGNRNIQSRDETSTLANALKTTRHWVESGNGEEGEPAFMVGAAARASVRPEDLARILDLMQPPT